MAYSLFAKECNFTEVLFGKSDAELVKERDSSESPCSSGTSSPTPSVDSRNSCNDNDHARNFFLLKVLDSLLEVHDPRVIQLPTHLPPPPVVPATSRPQTINTVPPTSVLLNSPMNFTVPPQFPPQHHAVSRQFLQNTYHPIPVPFVPTSQMMSIPPPPFV